MLKAAEHFFMICEYFHTNITYLVIRNPINQPYTHHDYSYNPPYPTGHFL